MVFYPDIPSGYFLLCTTSGTTGSNSLDFSDISDAKIYSDGGVVWCGCDFSGLTVLKRLLSDVRSIKSQIGFIIPNIDFYNATRTKGLVTLTNKTTSWNDDIPLEIPYSGYYILYGSGSYSGYTTSSRAMYLQINSIDIIRNSGATQGRDTICGPIWLQAGLRGVTIGYVGFSTLRVDCWHSK